MKGLDPQVKCLVCGSSKIIKGFKGLQCKMCGSVIKPKHYGVKEQKKLEQILVENPQDFYNLDEILVLRAEQEIKEIVFICDSCNHAYIRQVGESINLKSCPKCNNVICNVERK